MLRSVTAFLLLVAACGGTPVAADTAAAPTTAAPEPAPTTAAPEPAPTTAAPQPEPTAAKPDGSDCNVGTECTSGVCEGEGCDVPGKCMPQARACTKDLRQYCGCDGATFSGSGSCPGARFSKRAPC